MSTPDDIVTRLQVKDGVYTEFWQQQLMDEAADEIERLRALCDQLAEALRGYYDFGSSDAIEDNAAAALAAYEAARKEADRG
jgi:hypothetical protein